MNQYFSLEVGHLFIDKFSCDTAATEVLYPESLNINYLTLWRKYLLMHAWKYWIVCTVFDTSFDFNFDI